MPHRIGIIGLGTVGARFVELFGRRPDFDLVAAWDLDPAAAGRLAHPVPVVDGPDAVIAAADAVYVAVPPLHHRAYVEACVAAGVAIFCEKPLGVDVAESERLVELVRASGLPAGVNFVYSSAPAAVRLGDAVGAGDLGTVVGAELRLHFARWPREWQAGASWLADREQGGWVREVASHHLFLASRVLGRPVVRHSSVTYPDGPAGRRCEAGVVAELDCGDGPVPLTLLGTVGGAGPDVVELTVRGDRSSLRVADWYAVQRTDGGAWRADAADERPALAAAAYDAQLDELAAMLDGRPHRIATFDEALGVQRVVEAILAGRPAPAVG